MSCSSTLNPHVEQPQPKTDPVTALQDGIDGLSLAMFEALRSLRDAVAVVTVAASDESGKTLGQEEGECGGAVVALVTQLAQTVLDQSARIDAMMDDDDDVDDENDDDNNNAESSNQHDDKDDREMEEEDLAQEKHEDGHDGNANADTVDTQHKSATMTNIPIIHKMPGMNRTRAQQMNIIEGLIALNTQASHTLESTYQIAVQHRDACRTLIVRHAGEALNIVDDEK